MNQDYLLKVKIQNNKIITLMKAQGIESVAELARATKISQGVLGRLINMTESPLLHSQLFGKTVEGDGLWRKPVLVLADFLGVLPDEMFNDQQLTNPLTTNKAERVIELEQMVSLLGPKMDAPLLEDARFEEEKQKILLESLERLTPRSKKIIEQRFGLIDGQPQTLKQIGAKEKCTGARIREIEMKALRTLRSSTLDNKLVEIINEPINKNEFDYQNKITFILKDAQKKILLTSKDWRKAAIENNIHPPSASRFMDEARNTQEKLIRNTK